MMMMPKTMAIVDNTTSSTARMEDEGSRIHVHVSVNESSLRSQETVVDNISPSKTEDTSKDGEDKKTKPKDSPAFRLRPRRSAGNTPVFKTGSPGRPPKMSIFSKHSSFFSETTGNKGFEHVKRKLLQYLSQTNAKSSDDDSLDHDPQASMSSTSSILFPRKTKRPCVSHDVFTNPSQCIKQDVDMGIFMERITLPCLVTNQTYEKNYVSLKVISILYPRTSMAVESSPKKASLSLSAGIITRRRSHESQQQSSNGLLTTASSCDLLSQSCSPLDLTKTTTTSSSTAAAASALLSLSMAPTKSSESQETEKHERSERRSNDDNAQDGKIFQDHQTEHENREHLVKQGEAIDLSLPKIDCEQQHESTHIEAETGAEKSFVSFLVQDADAMEDSINWSSPGVVVDIQGCYADSLKTIEVGNVIEVTKFVTCESRGGTYSGSGIITYSPHQQQSPLRDTTTTDSSSSSATVKVEVVEEDTLKTSIQVLPLKIVVYDPNSGERVQALHSLTPSTSTPPATFLPIVSIKKKYSSLDNPLLLKVNIFGKKPEKPSPGLRFTSKVLRQDEIPGNSITVKEEAKEEITRPASRMMTRRSCSSSSSTSPLSSPIMTSRYSAGKTRRSQAQI